MIGNSTVSCWCFCANSGKFPSVWCVLRAHNVKQAERRSQKGERQDYVQCLQSCPMSIKFRFCLAANVSRHLGKKYRNYSRQDTLLIMWRQRYITACGFACTEHRHNRKLSATTQKSLQQEKYVEKYLCNNNNNNNNKTNQLQYLQEQTYLQTYYSSQQ